MISPTQRSLYPTTHNTHKRQIFTTPAGLEPTIPASQQQQTHALDRPAISLRNTINSLCDNDNVIVWTKDYFNNNYLCNTYISTMYTHAGQSSEVKEFWFDYRQEQENYLFSEWSRPALGPIKFTIQWVS